jgi:cytochrome c-type biogenesis protein CcmH/NrfF
MANTRQENKNIEQQMRQLGVLKCPVNPSQNIFNPSQNLAQQVATKIRQLTEQGLQAKRELEILLKVKRLEKY